MLMYYQYFNRKITAQAQSCSSLKFLLPNSKIKTYFVSCYTFLFLFRCPTHPHIVTCSSWHSCCSCLRLDWLLCLEPDCCMVWLYIFSRCDWYFGKLANPSLARRTGENLSFGKCKEFAKEFGAKEEKISFT